MAQSLPFSACFSMAVSSATVLGPQKLERALTYDDVWRIFRRDNRTSRLSLQTPSLSFTLLKIPLFLCSLRFLWQSPIAYFKFSPC